MSSLDKPNPQALQGSLSNTRSIRIQSISMHDRKSSCFKPKEFYGWTVLIEGNHLGYVIDKSTNFKDVFLANDPLSPTQVHLSAKFGKGGGGSTKHSSLRDAIQELVSRNGPKEIRSAELFLVRCVDFKNWEVVW